jgi:hypothetical protein
MSGIFLYTIILLFSSLYPYKLKKFRDFENVLKK